MSLGGQSATLDVLQERQINHYEIVEGDRELPAWTYFAQFSTLSETPRKGCAWSRER